MREFWKWDVWLWGAAVAAVGLNAAAGLFNTARMAQSERTLQHTRTVQGELNGLLSDLTDAETGHRGFVITADDAFLGPYRKGRAAVPERLTRLRALTSADTSRGGQLDEVAGLIDRKFTEMQRVLDLRTPGDAGLRAAAAAVGEGTGKRYMDDIRDRIGVMTEAEEKTLGDRGRAADEQQRTSVATLLVGAVIAAVAVIATAVLVRTELRARARATETLTRAKADAEAAAERFRESEGRFRTLAEAMPQIVWTADPGGRLEYLNARWYDFTGLSPARSVGVSWGVALHPDDAPRSTARWAEAVRTGTPFEDEHRFRRADGTHRWFLGRANPVRGEDGRVVRWLATCTDIDDRVNAARELVVERRFTESVLHSLPAHLAVIDADGTILAVNESWKRFGGENGMPAGYEWVGRSYYDPSREDGYGELALLGIHAVARGDQSVFEMEYPCHAEHEERHFLLRVVRFRGDGPVRLVLTHENITTRVLAERAARDAAHQLTQLTEGLPLLIWACRADGRCDYLSRQWAEYTGAPEDGQLGFRWLDRIHPDDLGATTEAWRAAVEDGADYDLSYRLRRHDGEFRWFAVRGIPVRDPDGRVVRWYGSCTDVDDRIRQAELLERLVADRTAALQASNDELEKFAYIASHDLQEPLRKIQAFGDRLVTRFRAAIGDQGKDYLDRMLESAARMRRLIDDLLAFSRVSTKAAAFVPVDLNAVVRGVLSDLEEQVRRTNGTVTVDPLPVREADAAQVRQLFQNLIGNALKFHREGVPPVVRVWAVPFADLPAGAAPAPPPGPGWRIAVADNGIGFEPQYVDRIFELFQRLHGRVRYEGTGLGLAIVRKIVVRHGGTISAVAAPDAGAAFAIDWPDPVPKD